MDLRYNDCETLFIVVVVVKVAGEHMPSASQQRTHAVTVSHTQAVTVSHTRSNTRHRHHSATNQLTARGPMLLM